MALERRGRPAHFAAKSARCAASSSASRLAEKHTPPGHAAAIHVEKEGVVRDGRADAGEEQALDEVDVVPHRPFWSSTVTSRQRRAQGLAP